MRGRVLDILESTCTKLTTLLGYFERRKATLTKQLKPFIIYVPHHAVSNINKPNKIRVLLDAAPEYQNSLLNKHFLKGPDLLNKLIAILLRFWNEEHCVMADIWQMFHQVFVISDDREVLRFIWRESEKEKFLEYVMNLHIFGKVHSLYVCNWSLKETALDNIGQFNEKVVKAVIDKFYMDDYLGSFDSLEEAISTSTGVWNILGNSGFELTKWSSNASQIIKTFPESELSPNHKNLDLIEPTIERVLGVLWNSEKDVIQIKVVQKPFQATKRKILSYVSSIFDPLGLLTPVLLRPKLIIQDLWRLK